MVTDTLEMGQVCCKPGLNLMTGPGNDSVSITNLLASQAQVLLFTTGRGNPLGTAVPTIKIASNSALFHRKPNWMDFNAGAVLERGSMDGSRPGSCGSWCWTWPPAGSAPEMKKTTIGRSCCLKTV